MYSKILYGVAMGFPVGITICDFFGSIAKVDGYSMQPTLNPKAGQNDFIFLSRWGRYNVNRGEIVVFISPKNPKVKIIKRVIGIGGDYVSTVGYKTNVVLVPKGYVWVEGDRADYSIDSNYFGPIPLGLVLAKASCIVWPLDRIQSLTKSVHKLK